MASLIEEISQKHFDCTCAGHTRAMRELAERLAAELDKMAIGTFTHPFNKGYQTAVHDFRAKLKTLCGLEPSGRPE